MIANLTAGSIRQRLRINGLSSSPVYRPFPADYFNHPPQPAAVLVPIFADHDGWNLLFIRRTEGENDRHAGQVAFPGGRADPGDASPAATALRESAEEIGIAPDEVEILGQLPPLHTISNYLVTPVVGLIQWPTALRLAPQEVARAFHIPLGWLADPANHEVVYPEIPGRPAAAVEVIYFGYYAGELLWGISARIVLDLIGLLTGTEPVTPPGQ